MDITKHIEKAEDAARRKNFDGAIALYHQLLDLQPDSGRARRGLREVLQKRWERKRSSKATAVVSGLVPLLSIGVGRLLRQHKVVSKGLERYLVNDPMNLRRNLMLGEALERAGCRESAIEVFEFAGGLGGGSAEGWKRAGALLYGKGEVDRALAAYENALEISPRDQEALKQRKNLAAEGALASGRYEEAKSARSLIKDQDAAQALEREAKRKLSPEEIDAELERLEGELAEAPRDADLLEKMGELFESKRDFGAALDCFERSAEQRPDSTELRERIARLRVADYDVKIADLKSRVKAGDERAASKLKRIETQKLEFELKEAEREIKEHPTDMPLRLRFGRILLRVDRVDDAVGELQRSVNDPRCRTDSLILMGQCFFKKNMLDLARKQLEKALESVSGMGNRTKDILYNLGVIAERMGAEDDARGFYARIYEADIQFRDVASKMEKLSSGS